MIPEWQQDREPWRYDATCAGMGPDQWDTLTPEQQINVCQDCPVITQCREWADQIETSAMNTYGVFGGETPGERVRRRLDDHQVPSIVCATHGRTGDVDLLSSGSVRCRQCRREAQARYRAKKRARLQAAKEDAA